MSIIKKSSPLRLRARRAEQESYAREYRQRLKRQIDRAEQVRDGKQGGASEVRRIDPTGYVPPEPKHSLDAPPYRRAKKPRPASVTEEKEWRKNDRAAQWLKRNG